MIIIALVLVRDGCVCGCCEIHAVLMIMLLIQVSKSSRRCRHTRLARAKHVRVSVFVCTVLCRHVERA